MHPDGRVKAGFKAAWKDGTRMTHAQSSESATERTWSCRFR